MLLKVISHKTAFVKFKIGNKFKQKVDETHSKQPNIHLKNPRQTRDFKNPKKKIPLTKSLGTFAKYW
jgi:hypothetical protein